MLNPAGNLSLKYTLRFKDEGNINNTCLPHIKVIRNAKGTTLCLPLILSGCCDFTDPCRYHLQVNDTKRLPGMSNADYKSFQNWMEENK